MKSQLKHIDCYPDKAQYLEGEEVTILLETNSASNIEAINVSITELANTLIEKNIKQSDFLKGNIVYKMVFSLPIGNYGVEVIATYRDEQIKCYTAFDIINNNTSAIRYGFLTDFSEQEKLDNSDIIYAVKLHLNALQFYDWMFRHDKLVSEKEDYCEPLGRRISLQTIKNKIHACKEHGIRPFAYGAVYAASKEAYHEHPDWALYKNNRETLCFADWLVFMDTSNNAPWCKHIIEEYAKAIKELGFQGIHMDTYGFPKHVWNHNHERISLAETFPDMIKKAKDAVVKVDAAAGVIFNAVNNWPMEFIANTEQDAVYIEVWPPHVTYHHLYSLIREAKFLGGKHVVLAAYMEPFKETKNMEDIIAAETALLLTNAVIQASGGTQLIFGETNGALCDSYYVNHATIREEFLPSIRLYCDFTVRYGKLLYDPKAMDISMTAANGINDDIKLTAVHNNSIKFSSYGEAGKIWSIIRESDRYLTIQLINLTNVNEFWNQPKYQRPEEIDGIQIDILMDTEIKGIYMATPDENSGIPCKLEYTLLQKDNGQHIVCNIAKLDIWNLVWIELI